MSLLREHRHELDEGSTHKKSLWVQTEGNRRVSREVNFYNLDAIMNYSTFFADAYCPDCRVRFEFQKTKKGKVEANNLKKARKAFGKRV